MRVVLLAALLARAVRGESLYAGSNVTQLNRTNFDATINVTAPHRVVVVEAYVSWCPHCQRMAPAYRRFATEALPWRPSISVAALDCVEHDHLCRRLKVWGYPTLFLFGDVRDTGGRHSVAGVDVVPIRHEGAFAEGHPARAIHELWSWVLEYAVPRTTVVSTEAELDAFKRAARRASPPQPCVLFVRDPFTLPAAYAEEGGAAGGVEVSPPPPPYPFAPLPAASPPPPYVKGHFDSQEASPPPPPMAHALPSATDDECAALTQPACLRAPHNCEPVIDCWSEHWISSCRWWHAAKNYSYDDLKTWGCACACRAPPPPPPPTPPPQPALPPLPPPAPPMPPHAGRHERAMTPRHQLRLLSMLAYELAPLRIAEVSSVRGHAARQLLTHFGVPADEGDPRRPTIAALPAGTSNAELYKLDGLLTLEEVAGWLYSFSPSRRRGGPTTTPGGEFAELEEAGGQIGAPGGGGGGGGGKGDGGASARAVWPVPAAELRASVMYALEAWVFAGGSCLGAQQHQDLEAWLSALHAHLPLARGDAGLLASLSAAVRATRLGALCIEAWSAELLGPLRTARFGELHTAPTHGGARPWSVCSLGPDFETCALWVTFHSLLANAADDAGARQALRAVHGFVRSFFGCHECQRHFGLMASELRGWLDEAQPSKRDVVLWLWRAHNTVSVRLNLTLSNTVAAPTGGDSGRADEGASDHGAARGPSAGYLSALRRIAAGASPHWLFPSAQQCAECYTPYGLHGYFPDKLDAYCSTLERERQECDQGRAAGQTFDGAQVYAYLEGAYGRTVEEAPGGADARGEEEEHARGGRSASSSSSSSAHGSHGSRDAGRSWGRRRGTGGAPRPPLLPAPYLGSADRAAGKHGTPFAAVLLVAMLLGALLGLGLLLRRRLRALRPVAAVRARAAAAGGRFRAIAAVSEGEEDHLGGAGGGGARPRQGSGGGKLASPSALLPAAITGGAGGARWSPLDDAESGVELSGRARYSDDGTATDGELGGGSGEAGGPRAAGGRAGPGEGAWPHPAASAAAGPGDGSGGRVHARDVLAESGLAGPPPAGTAPAGPRGGAGDGGDRAAAASNDGMLL